MLPIGPLGLIARGFAMRGRPVERETGNVGAQRWGLYFFAGRARGRMGYAKPLSRNLEGTEAFRVQDTQDSKVSAFEGAAANKHHRAPRHQLNVHRSNSFSVHSYNSSANASFFASNIIRPGCPTGS